MSKVNHTKTVRKLGLLQVGEKGQITQILADGHSRDLIERLMAMGFLEGAMVEVVHQAPFGGDPVAVRVRGTLLALRRQEANAIEVI